MPTTDDRATYVRQVLQGQHAMPVRSERSGNVYHVSVAVNAEGGITWWCNHRAVRGYGNRLTPNSTQGVPACRCAERCAEVLAEHGLLERDPTRGVSGERHAWRLTPRGHMAVQAHLLASASHQLQAQLAEAARAEGAEVRA